MTTPQRPVGCVVEVRYSARRPAASLRSWRSWAYLSWPTQPMKMTDFGGRMYWDRINRRLSRRVERGESGGCGGN